MIYIGIDPGEHNGVAFWDGKEIYNVKTYDFWGLIEMLADIRTEVTVILEDPNKIIATFPKYMKFYDGLKMNPQRKRAIFDVICQKVGENKGSAKKIAQYLENKGIEYKLIAPIKKKKWDKEMLERTTGYKRRTSQHARDAIRLVYRINKPLFSL